MAPPQSVLSLSSVTEVMACSDSRVASVITMSHTSRGGQQVFLLNRASSIIRAYTFHCPVRLLSSTLKGLSDAVS